MADIDFEVCLAPPDTRSRERDPTLEVALRHALLLVVIEHNLLMVENEESTLPSREKVWRALLEVALHRSRGDCVDNRSLCELATVETQ